MPVPQTRIKRTIDPTNELRANSKGYDVGDIFLADQSSEVSRVHSLRFSLPLDRTDPDGPDCFGEESSKLSLCTSWASLEALLEFADQVAI